MIALLDPDPVFAGDAAPGIDADAQDFSTAVLHPVEHAGLVAVVHDQRVHVAVARVENIGDFKAVAVADGVNLLQHVGQLSHRDRAVHAQIVRRNLADGAEGTLAALPDVLGRNNVLGDAYRGCAVLPRHGLDKGQLGFDFGLAALDFDDQQSLRIGRVPGAGKAFTGEYGGTIHELDGDRGPPGGHDRGHAGAGIQRRVKASEQRPGGFGLRHQPDGDFSDNAKLPLGTDDQAEQVVTGQVEGLAADLNHRTLHGHEGDPEDVVRRHPVLQAVRPARVHGDVAADGTGDLAGGVGRVEQAKVVHGRGDVTVGDASLHPGGLVLSVDLEDLVHLR